MSLDNTAVNTWEIGKRINSKETILMLWDSCDIFKYPNSNTFIRINKSSEYKHTGTTNCFYSRWRHDMGTLSVLLVLCVRKHHRFPFTKGQWVWCSLCTRRLLKQPSCRWCETPWRSCAVSVKGFDCISQSVINNMGMVEFPYSFKRGAIWRHI